MIGNAWSGTLVNTLYSKERCTAVSKEPWMMFYDVPFTSQLLLFGKRGLTCIFLTSWLGNYTHRHIVTVPLLQLICHGTRSSVLHVEIHTMLHCGVVLVRFPSVKWCLGFMCCERPGRSTWFPPSGQMHPAFSPFAFSFFSLILHCLAFLVITSTHTVLVNLLPSHSHFWRNSNPYGWT